MNPSLEDVAKHAGVSIATASRVLSGSDYPVRDATQEMVRTAAAELNYTPNALARSLITAESSTVGIIVGSIVDPFFAQITAGVEEYGSKSGILTMVCNGGRDLDAEIAYLELLRQHRVDGIIFAGGARESPEKIARMQLEITRARDQGVAIVAVGPRGFTGVHTILVDDRQMVFDLTMSLIQLGHRKLLFLEGIRGYSTSRLRSEGFHRALAKAGLDPMQVAEGGFDYEDGRRFVRNELSTWDRRSLPDAIVTANDNSALGVLAGLMELGIGVPEQISVAGLDDVRTAEIVGLSTARIPLRRLGRLAAQCIVERVQTQTAVILPHEIIHRRTTRSSHASPLIHD